MTSVTQAPQMRYTPEQMVAALHQGRGLQTMAARILGCSRQTVDRYVRRYAACREAIREERETMIDFAEAMLYQRVQQGDQWAIKFLLQTQGRDRGYGEQVDVEHTGAGGGPIVFTLDLGGGHLRALEG